MSSVPPTASIRSLMLMGPKALAPGRFDIEPHPIIRDREREPVRSTAEAHVHRPGFAVFQRVVQRFLHDTEHGQREIVRQIRRDVGVSERDRQVGLGNLALESVKRGDQTNQPQFRRMQAVREESWMLEATSCARCSASPASDLL